LDITKEDGVALHQPMQTKHPHRNNYHNEKEGRKEWIFAI